ncbi:predicted protein [Phaeodactylum tricornutum CCAP 1055/1]|jgi:mannosyltransferase OCH1-like enzyme|uniref:Uncharacterized protein n=2 Tax=Phaeodactylum tricornutum TaxID=2850 RepID=B7G8S2_PHATC|nr:predicted protein [Phaeodactylum tricornutum CCAP 1055/1]EEC45219.1 predicted protein [Phaeodactylum tricornutum CCAP 1055/1]|eukprot:XP_002183519.1 predicted protein [Phaeodactylum tricornutum CCAP 1055/1]
MALLRGGVRYVTLAVYVVSAALIHQLFKALQCNNSGSLLTTIADLADNPITVYSQSIESTGTSVTNSVSNATTTGLWLEPFDPDTSLPRSTDLLRELVHTDVKISCPRNLVLVPDTIILPEHGTESPSFDNQIPRVIHITSKSRCMTKSFAANVETWRFANHSLLIHNDVAMERLLHREWPEFPHLSQALECTVSGAARADLWRALILWEYGGIYTDMDNAPGPYFNASTIRPNLDKAMFVVESGGFLSQYFAAAAPRHPLVYLWIQSCLHRLLDLHDVTNQYVPFVTGPGALQAAMQHFMGTQGPKLPSRPSNDAHQASTTTTAQDRYDSFRWVRAGTYQGVIGTNATVRIEGSRQTSDVWWIRRNVIPRKKRVYQQMNMTHFGSIPRWVSNESCWQRIYRNRAKAW